MLLPGRANEATTPSAYHVLGYADQRYGMSDVIEWLHAARPFCRDGAPEALAHELREFFRPLRASVA
jgi:hypothetical protein